MFNDPRVSDYKWLYADDIKRLNELFMSDQRACEEMILKDASRFLLALIPDMSVKQEFSDFFYARLLGDNDISILHGNWKIISRRMTNLLNWYCQTIREFELGLSQNDSTIKDELTKYNENLYRLIHILEYLLDKFDIATQINFVLELLEGLHHAYPMKFMLWLQNSKIQQLVQQNIQFKSRYEHIMYLYKLRV